MRGIFPWLVLMTLLPQALSISCFLCHSVESWAKCEQNLRKFNCQDISSEQAVYDVCITELLTITQGNKTVIEYRKMCGRAAQCDGNECKAQDHTSCELHCCCEDYCNTGILGVGKARDLVASGFVFLACVLISSAAAYAYF